MTNPTAPSFYVISAEQVRRALPIERCIDLMRDVMRQFSSGGTVQLPRHILAVPGGAFGIMAGGIGPIFGAKLLSVFPGAIGNQPSHQGGILLFDGTNGAPTALVHAGAVTAIRTAAASAVATNHLARADAHRLAVLGYGEQAHAHIMAMLAVRPINKICVWGRDLARAEDFAAAIAIETGVTCVATQTAQMATSGADIVCTVTAAADPILFASDVTEGTHINAVGSSRAGPSEIDVGLVSAARYFGDSRANVLAQGAEFMRAQEAGLIDENHFLDEIGALLAQNRPGRLSDRDITLYKSLGHIVQDLAASGYVLDAMLADGALNPIDF